MNPQLVADVIQSNRRQNVIDNSEAGRLHRAIADAPDLIAAHRDRERFLDLLGRAKGRMVQLLREKKAVAADLQQAVDAHSNCEALLNQTKTDNESIQKELDACKKELSALRTQAEAKDNELDDLRDAQTEWKASASELDSLRNAQKKYWAVDSKALDNLRDQEAEWNTDAAELNQLRHDKTQWENDLVELQQLRTAKSNWESDSNELDQLRIHEHSWSNDKRQWESEATELKRLRLAESDWSSDLTELQRLRESENELKKQQAADRLAIEEFRRDEEQWHLDHTEVTNLNIERDQWYNQKKASQDQIEELQSHRNALSTDLATAQSDLALEKDEVRRITEERDLFQSSLADQSHVMNNMQLHITVLVVQSRWRNRQRNRQMQMANTQNDTNLATIAGLQGSVATMATENGMLRTSIVGLRLAGLFVCFCLKALRIDLATTKREKDLEIGQRLNLETKLQSLRAIAIISVQARIHHVDALRLQHQSIARRMHVANAFLLASFRSVRRELLHEQRQGLHYKRLFKCTQIVSHLQSLSLRRDRLELAQEQTQGLHYKRILKCAQVVGYLQSLSLGSIRRELSQERTQGVHHKRLLKCTQIVSHLQSLSLRNVRLQVLQEQTHGVHYKRLLKCAQIVSYIQSLSLRSVRLELSQEKMHYKRLLVCARIVSHVQLLSWRSLRAKLAAVEGEKAAEIQRRTSSDANVTVLRAMCRFLFDSKRTMRDELELVNAQLHDETALRMACQRVELNTRLAVYILYGLLRATSQTLGIEIDERKRLEGFNLFVRFGITQLCLVLRECRRRLVKGKEQWDAVNDSNLKLKSQLTSANASIDMQKDHIENLRLYSETREQNRVDAQVSALLNRLDRAVSLSNALIDERKLLRHVVAVSFRRESDTKAKLIDVARKAKQLAVKYIDLVQRLERHAPLLQEVLDACPHGGTQQNTLEAVMSSLAELSE